jgi:hypothetical protein
MDDDFIDWLYDNYGALGSFAFVVCVVASATFTVGAAVVALWHIHPALLPFAAVSAYVLYKYRNRK